EAILKQIRRVLEGNVVQATWDTLVEDSLSNLGANDTVLWLVACGLWGMCGPMALLFELWLEPTREPLKCGAIAILVP
ncbi:hypothetical protein Tco_0995103, partial [Tanacetum coccineum]